MKKYIKYSVAGLILSFAYCSFGLFIRKETAETLFAVFLLISDGLFFSGILLTGGGVVNYAWTQGLFDLFFYVASGRILSQRVTYTEYRVSRTLNQKNPATMISVGAGFLVLSVLFCIPYFL